MMDSVSGSPVEALFWIGGLDVPGWSQRLRGGLVLPGVEEERVRFSADRRCPDELAALYGDVEHWMRRSQQMMYLWLESVCQVQTSVF